VRKDGTTFWASGILAPLYDKKKALRGYTKSLRDNTARRKSEEALQRALRTSESIRASVESANRAKDEFIATVSHELRTPLNTIRLWSRMLASGRVPHSEWADGVRTIDRAALSQQQLIDDLLDVSRMASGQLRLAVRATRLAQAVKGAIEAIQPSADARKITVVSKLSDEVGVVRADPDRIQQVIWNLLTNAVKFTPGGGEIEVILARRDSEVEIAVKDSGIGIRPEFLPHVFERFRQAEEATTRQHGGLGLGLAIAKQLVELHGGTIGVESEGEGRGATFIVRLPLMSLSDQAQDGGTADSGIHQYIRKLTILLVEDDHSTREATCRVLEMHGAQVQAVATAAAALDSYASQPPELIISDIGLPGEDGFALIQQIRSIEQDRGLPHVPAIALTAFARAGDKQHALDAGFDEHMPKPVDIDSLVALIQRLGKPAD
jgi:signal transduction histidine kinase/ActR/RegA family two-component response regulator